MSKHKYSQNAKNRHPYLIYYIGRMSGFPMFGMNVRAFPNMSDYLLLFFAVVLTSVSLSLLKKSASALSRDCLAGSVSLLSDPLTIPPCWRGVNPNRQK